MKLLSEVLKESVNSFSDGVYIAVKVVFNENIQHICDRVYAYFGVLIDISDLHCTLIYSAKDHSNLSISSLGIDVSKKFIGMVDKITVWEHNDNKYFGIILKSDDLVVENTRLMEYGFVSDFEEYMPHITLQYGTIINLVDEDLRKLNNELKGVDVVLSSEYVEGLIE